MNVLLLITGLALILAGAHLLTDGAAAVAERLRIPAVSYTHLRAHET